MKDFNIALLLGVIYTRRTRTTMGGKINICACVFCPNNFFSNLPSKQNNSYSVIEYLPPPRNPKSYGPAFTEYLFFISIQVFKRHLLEM